MYAAAVGMWLCFRTDWDHQVQKVRERLAADSKTAAQRDVEEQPRQ